MKKRMMQLLLAACLCFGMTVVAAAEELPAEGVCAEEKCTEETEEEIFFEVEEETLSVNVAMADNDELYEAYLNSLFYESNELELFGCGAGENLDPLGGKLYEYLKGELQKVAAGEESSTKIMIDLELLEEWGAKTTWTMKELGCTTFTQAEADRMLTEFWQQFDFSAVWRALQLDCPYDLYWFGKEISYGFENISTSGGTAKIGTPYVLFRVADAYADGNDTTVDSEEVVTAKKAAKYAADFVDDWKMASDYEKLVAYRDLICELVAYDSDAAEKGSAVVGHSPWRLIYVFDGDSSTNVVCEGYAKAFQYLCDLSDFDDAVSNMATGIMMANGTQGPHMWNIVTLEGENYLVDVTNSDTNSIGQDGGLFLSGGTGTPETYYTFDLPYENSAYYFYESDMISLLGEDVVTLSETDYEPFAGGEDMIELPAPDLTVVKNANDPSGLPVGAIYYTNVPDSEEYVDCYIQVFDENGDLVESFYDTGGITGEYNMIRLATESEEPLTTGKYTIKAKYAIYDAENDEMIYGEGTTITYDYVKPSSSYKVPSVSWKNDTIHVDYPETLPEDAMMVLYIGYFYNDFGDGYLPLEESWAYIPAEDEDFLQEVFVDEMEYIQTIVEERIAESAYLADGYYQFRVRVLSDDICTKYHSDWSDWCKVGEVQGGDDVPLTPEKVVTWENGLPAIDTTVLKQAAEVEKVKVMAVLYDASGRCINVVMADYDAETGYDLSAFTAGASGTTAKVFLYGDKITPLCEESARP